MVVISLGAQTHRPLGLDELSRLIPGVGISAEMTSVFGLVIVFKERFEVFLLHPPDDQAVRLDSDHDACELADGRKEPGAGASVRHRIQELFHRLYLWVQPVNPLQVACGEPRTGGCRRSGSS